MAPRILIATSSGARPEAMAHDPRGYVIEWVTPLVVTPRFADTKRALGRLAEARTIALTSAHAVDAMVGALRAMGHDVRALFGIKLAAVGDATAAQLQRHGLSADLIADGGGAELAAEILSAQLPDPIWHLRALDARPELSDALVAAGKRVELVAAYETQPDVQALKAARLRHAAEPYAAIGLTSPRGAEALLDAFGVGSGGAFGVGSGGAFGVGSGGAFGEAKLQGVRLGAIGATTQAALAARGLDSVVPARPSVEALIALLCDTPIG